MGLGFALAGALKGLGGGLETQGKLDWEQRRQEALQNWKLDAQRLENEAARSETLLRADLQDRNSMRSETRQAEATRASNIARTKAEEARDEREFRQTKELKGLDHGYSVGLANLQNSFEIGKIERQAQLETERDAREANERITHWDRDENNRLVGVTKTGRIFTSRLTLAPKGAAAESDSLLGRARRSDQSLSPPSARTFTRAEVKEQASASGISEREVIRRAESLGYRLID